MNIIGPYYDTIIISDLHLGSATCEAKQLLTFLKSIHFGRLILLGDIFADLNFSRLKKDHWAVLSYFRKLSNSKRNIEIVWILGNHDIDLSLVMSHLVGIEVLDKYEWMADNKRCIAMHGHQFDLAILNWPWIADLLGWWYLQLQKVPGFKRGFPRWLDVITSHFQNLSTKVEKRAITYARAHGYDVICCGHTHDAYSVVRDGIEYHNSGCWVKEQGTCIAFVDSNIEIIQVGNDKN